MAKSIKSLESAKQRAIENQGRWEERFLEVLSNYYLVNGNPSKEWIVGRSWTLYKQWREETDDGGGYYVLGKGYVYTFADWLDVEGYRIWERTKSWQGNWWRNVTSKVIKQLRRIETRLNYWVEKEFEIDDAIAELEDAD